MVLPKPVLVFLLHCCFLKQKKSCVLSCSPIMFYTSPKQIIRTIIRQFPFFTFEGQKIHVIYTPVPLCFCEFNERTVNVWNPMKTVASVINLSWNHKKILILSRFTVELSDWELSQKPQLSLTF